MSGHSHWSTIKRKKGAVDAKRGREFSKLAKAIMIAARDGGGDPAMNLALRYAIDKAKAANMTKDAISRATKKGTGELAGGTIEHLTYEGYGPAGVAIFVECLSDSRNRTSGQISHIFDSRGGSMGSPGCVSWMFSKKGVIAVSNSVSEEKLMEVALDAGADDIEEMPDGFEVTCKPVALDAVKGAIEAAGIAVESAEVTNVPQNYITLGKDDARKILRLMEALDDNDDVQAVHANFDIPVEILEEIQN
ncbi:MAG: YebC/PmpR family DNA-binding transcriptional regulator [Phycisphaerae bacterium]|jgi:YebC/PmpR family DNA-binding regulatory protein|nr:YebC/PmpR family DNA-binding transcriptional regulator [Phycisphaerae bacterium]